MSAGPTLEEIRQARARIAPYVMRTPLRRWNYLETVLGFKAPIYLKLENLQRTGSFKVRGGANKILKTCESGKKPPCLVAASAGNHAQAVAYVAGKLGIPSKIVMPEGAPLVKAAATSDYGAEVILHGIVYDDAFAKAQDILAATPGAVYVHAYEDADVIAGQGTAGLEIHEQLAEDGLVKPNAAIQTVIPIGGGGLICGIGSALTQARPGTKVYGVVSQAAPAMAASLKQGRIIPPSPERKRTLAEGLAVKKVSAMTFEILRKFVSDIAVVDDTEIAVAITTLMERGKLITEGAGAAGVAALLAGKITLDPNVPLVVVLCGGNIDMNILSNILERGFSRSGRWLTLQVTVEDKPGELARLTREVAELKANVLEVTHDRTSARGTVGNTFIKLLLETQGREHADKICGALKSSGYDLEVQSK